MILFIAVGRYMFYNFIPILWILLTVDKNNAIFLSHWGNSHGTYQNIIGEWDKADFKVNAII